MDDIITNQKLLNVAESTGVFENYVRVDVTTRSGHMSKKIRYLNNYVWFIFINSFIYFFKGRCHEYEASYVPVCGCVSTQHMTVTWAPCSVYLMSWYKQKAGNKFW